MDRNVSIKEVGGVYAARGAAAVILRAVIMVSIKARPARTAASASAASFCWLADGVPGAPSNMYKERQADGLPIRERMLALCPWLNNRHKQCTRNIHCMGVERCIGVVVFWWGGGMG